MLEKLNKFFVDTMGLTPEYWLYILLGVVALAFFVSVIAGFAGGDFVKIKKLMNAVVKNPSTAVASMKKMPVSVKNQYRRARVSGVKPSDLVTENDCVTVPYARSLASKIWLVTLVATVLCAAIGFFVCYAMDYASLSGVAGLAEAVEGDGETPPAAVVPAVYSAPALVALTVLIAGGIFTFIGAVVGCGVKSGALKTYAKFARALDGDAPVSAASMNGAAAQTVAGGADRASEQPQFVNAEPQYAQAEDPTPVYAETPMYAEPQAQYVEPEPIAAEPVIAAEPQESEEELRRRAREEALAQAKAQQAAAQQAAIQQQAAQQAQAQAQAQAAQQQAQPAAPSSADDVIAQIEKINREGAPRETMREVATLLQKERAKPENKTPEQQRKLNEALSKLLKAMAASKK